ncbi:L-seryl-tRNA(Sec) selenium transferase [Austwickia sp. TVS 96-490-7B]|uniref:hypothetical protein n=1 Tax=Austwickia sp. TVS 96-490-7B TaxID=2830843 RepID=UPI001D733A01|nr:hypothetical protein [Austwickia sp. TVS 96-490-7B]MBW3085976.1 L-seryl-tRNA(Sec) selenium transferase [Austwickia sp. TVS 96-490-7B]
MPSADDASDARRRIPRTDDLLAAPELHSARQRVGTAVVRSAIVEAQEAARRGQIAPEDVLAAAVELSQSHSGHPCTMQPVLNATGLVVHPNLGRAPLSRTALDAVTMAAGYVDVEYDITTGSAGTRGEGARTALLAACRGAQDALVVNNGAAALTLAAATFTADDPGLISRGEMIETGDGVRIPELLGCTGATTVEVGTTNHTTITDYAQAAARLTRDLSGGRDRHGRREHTPRSSGLGAIWKIHSTAHRIEGFTASAGIAELAELAAEIAAPLIVDIGNGLIAPDPALPDETDAATVLSQGADLVIFSGDKYLGGPQSGIILGRSDLVERMRRHPLQRAMRVDKLALAALEATLRGPEPPVTTYLRVSTQELHARTARLESDLRTLGLTSTEIQIVTVDGLIGDAPGQALPGVALALPEAFAEALRHPSQPKLPTVVTRIESGRCLLDLRCIDASDEDNLREALYAASVQIGIVRADALPAGRTHSTVRAVTSTRSTTEQSLRAEITSRSDNDGPREHTTGRSDYAPLSDASGRRSRHATEDPAPLPAAPAAAAPPSRLDLPPARPAADSSPAAATDNPPMDLYQRLQEELHRLNPSAAAHFDRPQPPATPDYGRTANDLRYQDPTPTLPPDLYGRTAAESRSHHDPNPASRQERRRRDPSSTPSYLLPDDSSRGDSIPAPPPVPVEIRPDSTPPRVVVVDPFTAGVASLASSMPPMPPLPPLPPYNRPLNGS